MHLIVAVSLNPGKVLVKSCSLQFEQHWSPMPNLPLRMCLGISNLGKRETRLEVSWWAFRVNNLSSTEWDNYLAVHLGFLLISAFRTIQCLSFVLFNNFFSSPYKMMHDTAFIIMPVFCNNVIEHLENTEKYKNIGKHFPTLGIQSTTTVKIIMYFSLVSFLSDFYLCENWDNSIYQICIFPFM